MKLQECHTALVHHWFVGMTGGERVCEAICEILDTPDLFSLVAKPDTLSPVLKKSPLSTSFVQRIPGALKWYRYYACLFPLAVELFDLGSYDLVISSDASTVKGVITGPQTCHICYCHSPMRYAWNMFHDYRKSRGALTGFMMALVMHYLRLWDYSASARVDYFAANSHTVKNRIKTTYGRDARVIYPPCDTERFSVSDGTDDYYLFVGRLVDYKRADLAVRAFCDNGRRLLIIGDGPQKDYVKSISGKNIEILEWVSDDDLSRLYSRCKALIFPGEEDFGIVPVEAQASGRPVIACGRGGALETVVPGKTGLFFSEQTPSALNQAVAEFESRCDSFDSQAIRRNAERFDKERFHREFAEFIQECLDDHTQRFPRAPSVGES